MSTFKIVSKIRKMDVWNIVKDAMTVSNDATEEPVKIKRRNRRRRQKTNEVNQVRL